MPRPVLPAGSELVHPTTQLPGLTVPVLSEPLIQFSPENGSPQPPPCSVPLATFLPWAHLSFLPAISASRIVLEVPSVMAAIGVAAFADKQVEEMRICISPKADDDAVIEGVVWP